ncbi:MAG: AbrB/MazE/SpoVT family DNA-binding domain-containing protein [Candidatus Woesearchaeota archaeon]
MKRSVIKQGFSTFVISLPSRWVKKHGIKKGDELEITEGANSLLISTHPQPKRHPISVDVSELDRTSLVLLIRSLYRVGYEEINLSFSKESTFHFRTSKKESVIAVIHEEINRLVGMETVQQKKGVSKILSLTKLESTEFDIILRRIFLLILDLLEDFEQAYISNNKPLLQTIEDKHNTISKFVSCCVRILALTGGKDARSCILYSILTLLDKLVDEVKGAARMALRFDVSSKKSKKLLQLTHNSFNLYYGLFYKYDEEVVVKISSLKEELSRELVAQSKGIGHGELIVAVHLLSIAEIIRGLVELRISLQYYSDSPNI